MDILGNAKTHFKNLDTRSIEVAEWGSDDQPAVIYSAPLTLQEKSKLYRMAKDDDIALLAHAVILKATDSEGNKLFTVEHKRSLMTEVDPDVLARVGAFILAGVTVEEAEKN